MTDGAVSLKPYPSRTASMMQLRSRIWGALALAVAGLIAFPAFALPPDQEQAFIQRSRPHYQVMMSALEREKAAIYRRIECLKQRRPGQKPEQACPMTEIEAARRDHVAAKAQWDQVRVDYDAAEAEYQRRLANTPKPVEAAPLPQKPKQQAAAKPTGKQIVSGNWVASCAEQKGSGGVTVTCQRYGGFLDNTFPASCDANNLFVCRNRSLCSLASEVVVLASDASPRLQAGIASCPGHRRP